MKDLTQLALDAAVIHGASYADIRIILSKSQRILVKNGEVETLNNTESLGFGIRVIVNGSWGFASSSILTKSEIKIVAKRAVEIAKASATLRKDSVRLAPEAIHHDIWTSPYLIDPFKVTIDEKLDLLFKIDEILRKDDKIKVAESGMNFWREHQWLATTEGTFIEQILLRSGSGYSATAVDGPNVQVRSYPASFGGQYSQMGYEFILGTPFVENAERVRDEAVALLSAPDCPVGDMDLIIGGSQLALQIHESIGHPSELDRVLGMEANYAGTSFLTTDLYKDYHYGSPIVNVVADATVPTGLGTFGYDDDGVRAALSYDTERIV